MTGANGAAATQCPDSNFCINCFTSRMCNSRCAVAALGLLQGACSIVLMLTTAVGTAGRRVAVRLHCWCCRMPAGRCCCSAPAGVVGAGCWAGRVGGAASVLMHRRRWWRRRRPDHDCRWCSDAGSVAPQMPGRRLPEVCSGADSHQSWSSFEGLRGGVLASF